MLERMTIARALPEFNNLGRSVTLAIFLLMDHFLYDFLGLAKKRLEVRIVCKMHHRNTFFLALRLSVQRFRMPLEGLSFVKT